MKKILLILAVSLSLFSFSQVKIKDLPTTTTGSTGDFLLKDDVAGVAGSTKKISIANFVSTYTLTTGTGTTGNYVKFNGTPSLSNALAKDSVSIFTLGSTKGLMRRFQYIDGNQSSGYILKSDGSGNATWQAPYLAGYGMGLTGTTFKVDTSVIAAKTWVTANSLSGLTTNYIPVASSSTTLINGILLQKGHNVTIPTGRYFSSTDTLKSQIDLSYSATDGQINITTDGGTGNKAFVYLDQTASQVGFSDKTLMQSNATDCYIYATDGVNSCEVTSNVNGNITASGNKLSITTNSLTIDGSATGYGANKVLTSDASGNATWQTPSSPISGGTINYIPQYSSSSAITPSSLRMGNDTLMHEASGNFINFNDGTGGMTIFSGGQTTFNGNVTADQIRSLGTVFAGTASTTNGVQTFYNSTNANTATIQSGVTSATYVLNLPTAQGSANTYLKNDGSGNLSWASTTSGSVTSIATGNGITGGTITTTGTLGLSGATGDIGSFSGTNTYSAITAVASGKILQAQGLSTKPAYTPYTLPTSVGSTGKLLISDGTNYVNSTPTFPNAAPTAGAYLRGDGTNFITSTLILPNAATASYVPYATATDTWGGSSLLQFTDATGGGTLRIGGGTTVATNTFPQLQLDKSSQNATVTIVNNLQSAASGNFVYNGADLATSLRFQLYGTSFATSGIQIANEGSLFTTGTGIGLNIGTFSTGALKFWGSNIERMRMLTTGEFLLGGSTQIGSELLSLQRIQNAQTYQVISNTNSSTASFTSLDLKNATTTGRFAHMGTGYTTSGPFIQDATVIWGSGAGGLTLSAANAAGIVRFYSGGSTERWRIDAAGGFGNTAATATAYMHLKAGTATASTAPLKLSSGTNLTAAEAGALEYDGTSLFFTNSGAQRQQLQQVQSTRVSTQFDKTSSTALADITGLTASVVAGKTYSFEAILYTTSGTSGGSKASISGTCTATSIIYEGYSLDTDNAGILSLVRATALDTEVANNTTTTKTSIRISGTITVNASGTLTPKFAQNASDGTTSSVLVGSTFRVTQIP